MGDGQIMAVRLLDAILGLMTFEKILLIKVSEFFLFLVDCIIRGRSMCRKKVIWEI